MTTEHFVPATIDILAIRPEIPDGAIILDQMEKDWDEIDLQNSKLGIAPLKPYLAWQASRTDAKLRRKLRRLVGAELIRVTCRLEDGPEGRPIIAEVIKN